MWDTCTVWSLLIGLFRSRASLEGENLFLRQQIIVLRRTAPKRLCFSAFDRLMFVGLYRRVPDIRDALAVVRPETVIRWHRAGFRSYWRWRSRARAGRPKAPVEIRLLIRETSLANPLWGPRGSMATAVIAARRTAAGSHVSEPESQTHAFVRGAARRTERATEEDGHGATAKARACTPAVARGRRRARARSARAGARGRRGKFPRGAGNSRHGSSGR